MTTIVHPFFHTNRCHTPNWGNAKDIVKLIEFIAYKEKFGETLSEGVYQASKVIGRNSEKFAMQVKKVGINEQGLHSLRAWALGIAVSTRGGGHLSVTSWHIGKY